MNTADKAIVVLLFVLLIAWGFYQRTVNPPSTVQTGMPSTEVVAVEGETNAVATAISSEAEPPVLVAPQMEPEVGSQVEIAPVDEPETQVPERIVSLGNDELLLNISSRGAAVVSATLTKYRASVDPESGPVVLEFSKSPALSIRGIPGLSVRSDFELSVAEGSTQAVARATTPDGIVLERRLSLEPGYRVTVTDTFTTLSGEKVELPGHAVALGPMASVESRSSSRGISYLGLDTLPDLAGRDVTHWGKKKIPEFFGRRTSVMSCARQNATAMPLSIRQTVGTPVSWVAAKNKFFVQILAPETAAPDCELYATRSTNTTGVLKVSEVAASLDFTRRVIEPGETFCREMNYYIGPKKYEILRGLGGRQSDVMQFGWWGWFRWLCTVLLGTLNAIYAVLPNYGVAIILLTIIVKIVFWPLTHKSTESAKKMQQIQPLVAELREKYKGQSQKMQQAQMALYKEHGVNPMASCLPMLIQLPIFIALFTVLRSAVELRFAPFLWVPDLSEPEGLFASVLPVPLNILPIMMTVTMVFQQRLTPTAGDPQQQKMMMFMPVIMLFVLYNMASALVLYWTVSQCLSIAQLLWQRRARVTAAA